jgi:hypothetical protein
MRAMISELDVLARVDSGLSAQGLSYILTGSFAMAHYTQPRMTRDIDLVVSLAEVDVPRLVQEFSTDFYIDADMILSAVARHSMFNILHSASAVKVAMIVRKANAYRLAEFERRTRTPFGSIHVWIVSREDLILSKLAWGKDSGSELQRKDVLQLLDGPVDSEYLRNWAPALGVEQLLSQLRR